MTTFSIGFQNLKGAAGRMLKRWHQNSRPSGGAEVHESEKNVYEKLIQTPFFAGRAAVEGLGGGRSRFSGRISSHVCTR